MILTDIKVFTKILKELQIEINMAMDVSLAEVLFEEAQCNYTEILSDTIDDIVSKYLYSLLSTFNPSCAIYLNASN